jgi:hypothetical protein
MGLRESSGDCDVRLRENPQYRGAVRVIGRGAVERRWPWCDAGAEPEAGSGQSAASPAPAPDQGQPVSTDNESETPRPAANAAADETGGSAEAP